MLENHSNLRNDKNSSEDTVKVATEIRLVAVFTDVYLKFDRALVAIGESANREVLALIAPTWDNNLSKW